MTLGLYALETQRNELRKYENRHLRKKLLYKRRGNKNTRILKIIFQCFCIICTVSAVFTITLKHIYNKISFIANIGCHTDDNLKYKNNFKMKYT